MPLRAGSPWLHRLKISVIVLVILFGVDLLLDSLMWPFTEQATIASLEKVSGCDVKIGQFHQEFVPHPGYSADKVVFTRNAASRVVTLASVDRLHCRASWNAFLTFTHRVSRMELTGLRVMIPSPVPPPLHTKMKAGRATTVTDLFATGAVLQIAPGNAQSQPLQFDFPQLHLSNLARDKVMHFQVRLVNAHLIGTVDAHGSFGPLRSGDLKGTAVAGMFQVSNLDLGAYKEIAGVTSASGRFEGQLRDVRVRGNVAIPDFEIRHSRHAQGLTAEYRARVDGTRGNVAVDFAAIHFLSSTLLAHGIISRQGEKRVDLDVDGQHASVQDLLRLFVRSEPAPMYGPLALRAHVMVMAGSGHFLKRVRLDGNFKILNGVFGQSGTKEKVTAFSARASGRKNQVYQEPVSVQLASHVELRNEVATLSGALFAIPGALVRGGGTYDLSDEGIDLRGKLAMQATLSQAATGLKSVLAIPLDPFFKKPGAGAVIQVRMTGTYSHPSFKMTL